MLMPLRTTPTTVGSRRGPCYLAREAGAGRPDLRFHDLRHTGAVLAAQTGATLAELMGRLGHSTPQAALRYQHAAQGKTRKLPPRCPGEPGHALTERASSPGGSIVYTPADTLLGAGSPPSSKLRLSIPVYKTSC